MRNLYLEEKYLTAFFVVWELTNSVTFKRTFHLSFHILPDTTLNCFLTCTHTHTHIYMISNQNLALINSVPDDLVSITANAFSKFITFFPYFHHEILSVSLDIFILNFSSSLCLRHYEILSPCIFHCVTVATRQKDYNLLFWNMLTITWALQLQFSLFCPLWR